MNKNLKIKLLCSLIIVIICITIVIIIKLNNSKTCAVELSKNSSLSTEMIEKIAKITKSEEKVAYLTFDDGPTTAVTPKILDILKDYRPVNNIYSVKLYFLFKLIFVKIFSG